MATSEGEVEKLKAQLRKLEEEHAQLQIDNARLQSAYDTADKSNTAYEECIRKDDKQLTSLKKTVKEQKADLEKANNEARDRERHITALEKQLADDAETLKQKETDFARLQQSLDAARASQEATNVQAVYYKKKSEDTVEDCKGLRAQCAALKKAGAAADKASAELSNLRIQAAIFRDAAADIKFERDRNKALREEILKLKEDIDTLGFTPDAAELHNQAITPSRKTLEDELADAQSSASEAESDGESNDDNETLQPSHCVTAPVLPEVAPAPVRPEVALAPAPPEVMEKIVEKIVTQDVYVTRTTFVDRPFQVSAHHPFKCWLQVELNFLVLFYAFITTFFSLIASFSRKISAAPAIEESTKPTTSNSTSGETTPTIDTQRVTDSLQNLTTESTNGLQPDGGPQETATQAINEQQVPEVDLEPLRPSAWSLRTITNPKEMPSARTTILALACHVVVYTSVLLMYCAYTERRRWLDANDGTRIFVRQLLNHPSSFHSGVSKILFMLPEEWKHAIDRTLFEKVVLGSNIQISQPRPG